MKSIRLLFVFSHLLIGLVFLLFQNCSDLEPVRPPLEGLDSLNSLSNEKSCEFAGATIFSGQVVAAYSQQTVALGSSCDSVKMDRTCRNGELSGDPNYNFSSCTVANGQSCQSPNGPAIPHGQTVIFYSATISPPGQTCASVAQQRTCNNGVLSGTAQYSTCANGLNCSGPGNTIVLHGQSKTYYTTATAPFGQSCNSYSQQRSCNNGLLTGDAQYANCNVSAADTRCPMKEIKFDIPGSNINVNVVCDRANNRIGVRVQPLFQLVLYGCTTGVYTTPTFSGNPAYNVQQSGFCPLGTGSPTNPNSDFNPGQTSAISWPLANSGQCNFVDGTCGWAAIRYDGSYKITFEGAMFGPGKTGSLVWSADGNYQADIPFFINENAGGGGQD